MIKDKRGEGTELGSSVVELLIAVLVIACLIGLIVAVIYIVNKDDAKDRAIGTLDEIADQMNALKGKNGQGVDIVLKIDPEKKWVHIVYVPDKTSSKECLNAKDYYPGQGCICIFTSEYAENNGCDDAVIKGTENCEGYCRNSEYPIWEYAVRNGKTKLIISKKPQNFRVSYHEDAQGRFFGFALG